MKLTTDEAFEKIKQAGITQNRNVFLKMVREGKIPGRMSSKKRGYRFEDTDVHMFIKQYQQDEEFDIGAELERLYEQNDALTKRLRMPKDFWMRENRDLLQQLHQRDKYIEQLLEEIKHLKNDKTIRVRVE